MPLPSNRGAVRIGGGILLGAEQDHTVRGCDLGLCPGYPRISKVVKLWRWRGEPMMTVQKVLVESGVNAVSAEVFREFGTREPCSRQVAMCN